MTNLNELYDFWFSDECKPYYFNQSNDFDDIIFKKYRQLIETHILIENPTLNEFVSQIILYDQIPRHMYRGNKQLINKYHLLIIPYINTYYRQYKDKLNLDEFSFVLLPLRHTNNFNYLCVVLRETWNKIKQFPDEPQYKRFLEASYKRYLKFNDDSDNLIFYANESHIDFNIYDFINYHYLDQKCIKYELLYEDSYKVKSFDEVPDNEIISQFIKKYKITDCIISLSGGVDSMVLSYYLKKYGVNVYALHINYLNRKECRQEEEIIINWARQLNMPLFIRQIDEIKRKQCMDNNLRELYEDYTRDIRYQSYRNVMKKIGISMPVFLGHNKDDCFENILTNITSKSHYENLLGMEDMVNQGDIIFARPMLTIEKKDIYEMAENIHIPFFVDSTPKWSQRGKIRDIIRPTLEDWNFKIVDSMFYLSNIVGQLMGFISDHATQFVESYKLNNYIIIKINEFNTNQSYWNLILQQLNIRVSTKSLNEFIKKMTYIKYNCNTFAINEKHKHMLNKNHYMEYYLEKNKESLYFSFIEK